MFAKTPQLMVRTVVGVASCPLLRSFHLCLLRPFAARVLSSPPTAPPQVLLREDLARALVTVATAGIPSILTAACSLMVTIYIRFRRALSHGRIQSPLSLIGLRAARAAPGQRCLPVSCAAVFRLAPPIFPSPHPRRPVMKVQLELWLTYVMLPLAEGGNSVSFEAQRAALEVREKKDEGRLCKTASLSACSDDGVARLSSCVSGSEAIPPWTGPGGPLPAAHFRDGSLLQLRLRPSRPEPLRADRGAALQERVPGQRAAHLDTPRGSGGASGGPRRARRAEPRARAGHGRHRASPAPLRPDRVRPEHLGGSAGPRTGSCGCGGGWGRPGACSPPRHHCL